MPNPPERFEFGTFVAARADHPDYGWRKGDLAVIFSKSNSASVDLLFENGKTLFDLPGDAISLGFQILFTDDALILDGCSTHPGWAKARSLLGG